MKFLDLFSGIGGFRLGMEMAGHECVGHVEWDKYAQASYMAMHNVKESEYIGWDIRKVRADELPRADVWCFGFPCQDISIAGKTLGFAGERSSLFFAVTRIIRDLEEESKPSILFIENVKNLLSVNGGADFLKLLIELDEIGYDAEWQVLNSKYFGVPQNRERVFIIGHFRGRGGREVFPIGGTNREVGLPIKRIAHSSYFRRVLQTFDINGSCEAIDTMQGGNRQPCVRVLGNVHPSGKGMNGNVFDSQGLAPTLTTNKGEGLKVIVDLGNYERPDYKSRYAISNLGIAPTLAARDYKSPIQILIKENTAKGYVKAYEDDGIRLDHIGGKTGRGRVQPQRANTLTTGNHVGVIEKGFRIRKLTPKECFRLQGFPDEYFERAAAVNSNSQLYKQAGNSVTVNVIYEIAKRFTEIV